VGLAPYTHIVRVFVYEYLTATGTGRDPASPAHGLFREGRAMRDAVAADFARIPGVQVSTLDDAADEAREFAALALGAVYTLVIAPEFDGILEERVRWAEGAGTLLLGPSADLVAFAGDKAAVAAQWRAHGVRTPATTTREPTPCEGFPVVWKPRDGCGSTATFLLRDAFDLARAKATRAAEGHTGEMIVQEYVGGKPASVALLVGAAGVFPLAPCFQHISDDGRFGYSGGESPIPPDLAARAVRLAARAVECVPSLMGYVGVDLILGDANDGSRDYAIEINPRLTTSYVGLREVADFNIAEQLTRVVGGRAPEPMRWKGEPVKWTTTT
jgi:predicted ATP-grasp superfamily ATP-dependent carboligase